MINILISTDSRYPVNRKVIKNAIEQIFENNKISRPSAEISVAVVGSRKMNGLLAKYMDDGEKHSILAFPLEEVTNASRGFVNPPSEPLVLGDIVLCWPEVLAEAAGDDMLVDDKVAILCAHGTKHLLGIHHE